MPAIKTSALIIVDNNITENIGKADTAARLNARNGKLFFVVKVGIKSTVKKNEKKNFLHFPLVRNCCYSSPKTT